jgi:hypothetical protein
MHALSSIFEIDLLTVLTDQSRVQYSIGQP